jgi:Protein of unknown function (DUF1579)
VLGLNIRIKKRRAKSRVQGAGDSQMREVITVIDANTQKMVIYGAGMDGKEAKFMEFTMKRAM